MSSNIFRIKEIALLFYRMFLAFFFYFLARLFFYFYNFDLLNVSSTKEFLELTYHGVTFDRMALFYVNLLFILLSIIPTTINTRKGYQRLLCYVYFVFNLIAYMTNFIDFIYYRFIYSRTTIAVLDSLEHETNKVTLFSKFLVNYWHVFLLFVLTAMCWVYLYKRIGFKEQVPVSNKKQYFISSILLFIGVGVGVLAGIRGDLKKSTRPLNLIDANRYVSKPEHADLVLNTPFAIIRTFGKTSFAKVQYVSEEDKNRYVSSVKQYHNNPEQQPNIVLFITESFSKEYIGAFNTDQNIPNYVSYTPYLDSLAAHSLIFTNAFANGSKSIHGMSSVLAGIPSFKDAFTSSPYPKQEIESLVSTLKSKGYDTSFFHGAPNGSMGFLGFGNILGFDHYYGKTEFDNDSEFDGVWGIWDEPFFLYMKDVLSTKKEPFFSTLFSVSSHEPFNIPAAYKGKFPLGNKPIHQTIGYTDYAFQKFFEAAQQEPWYDNTIFIITADHTNQVDYDEYLKVVNRSAVPILFFTPDGRLQGKNIDLAQQIDIYPTVLDLIGYPESFRSWGRSLVGDQEVQPFVINYGANQYTFQRGRYICRFDGQKVTGFFDIEDKGLAHNLIDQRNAEMDALELACKAFLQDYFERIVDRKLH